MKLYLSGPMTGIAEFNVPAFTKAAQQLRDAGYEVVSPAESGTGENWTSFLRADIKLLVDCDAIALMDGWKGSKGARLEHHIADELGMIVGSVAYWLRPRKDIDRYV